MKRLLFTLSLVISVFVQSVVAQSYRPIHGWSEEINQRLESFLNATRIMQERKVAVFDCDGTTFGQVPHYLADEALYQYADEVLKKRNDREAAAKLAILDRMVKDGNKACPHYFHP